MNRVQKIEEKLADDFEHTEIHDLRFVVLELSQPMVDFRSNPDLKPRGVSLAWLHLKPWHVHRAFDTGHVLRAGNVERTAPNARSEERRVGKECRSRWSPYH